MTRGKAALWLSTLAAVALLLGAPAVGSCDEREARPQERFGTDQHLRPQATLLLAPFQQQLQLDLGAPSVSNSIAVATLRKPVMRMPRRSIARAWGHRAALRFATALRLLHSSRRETVRVRRPHPFIAAAMAPGSRDRALRFAEAPAAQRGFGGIVARRLRLHLTARHPVFLARVLVRLDRWVPWLDARGPPARTRFSSHRRTTVGGPGRVLARHPEAAREAHRVFVCS